MYMQTRYAQLKKPYTCRIRKLEMNWNLWYEK
jgi:hypothetical protein